MIRQRYDSRGRDLWPERDDVPRAWTGHHFGSTVLLRKYPQPGHEIDGDYPPTIELTVDEWRDATADISITDALSRPVGAALGARLDALAWDAP